VQTCLSLHGHVEICHRKTILSKRTYISVSRDDEMRTSFADSVATVPGLYRVKVKVKQSRYRPIVAQRVPGS